MSKIEIAIVFVLVVGALCVALYQAWIDPFQALVVLVLLVGIVLGLAVIT